MEKQALLPLCTAGDHHVLICFDGYLSLYVFVLSLLLPVVSLACSLPGMLCTKVKLSTGKGSHAPRRRKYARKGESIPLQPGSVERPPRFPAGVSG